MRRFRTALAVVLATALTGWAAAALAESDASSSSDLPIPEIPHTKFQLDNGLTVVVHEDHKTPVVAVNVWYHVGSKNETRGRTGFAHLFEHLMFNGTEHYDGEYFAPFEAAGATEMNGTTGRDRTNYFQNVPTSALDLALWMESERMGHLLGAVGQGKLDEQRGVVMNEKRQRENQPYGKVWELIAENTYPADHSYSWPVIGYMEDLEAATLDDVREWFRTYYGAANAVVVLAGDITPEEARRKMEHYFGAIDAGPPLERPPVNIAPMTGERRQVMEDRVPQARLYKVWNIPRWGEPATDHLELVGQLLSVGKNSRLYERLVYEEQLATDVMADIYGGEIGSQFIIQVTAKPGVVLADLEAALDEELNHFLEEGPQAEELERTRTALLADALRQMERVGGFGGKSDILAQGEVYRGQPDFFRTQLQRQRDASAEELRASARTWLSDGVYVLEVHPYPQHRTTEAAVDRSALPEVTPVDELDMPGFETAELDNGLRLLVAERGDLPLIGLQLLVDGGYAADRMSLPGTANLTLDLMDEGIEGMDALAISDALERLGARLSTSATLDSASVTLSALRERLKPSLDLFAQVVRAPTFPEAELERKRAQVLAQIQQEKSQPFTLALRSLPPLLYGDAHPYGIPFTGSGTEPGVRQIKQRHLQEFHNRWFHPKNATLVVVGDTTLAEIRPQVEAVFGDWRSPDTLPEHLALPEASQPEGAHIYLLDRPGAEQSVVIAGQLAPPADSDLIVPLRAATTALGGLFTSRLNMNLREEKHWSYGAKTQLVSARGQEPWLAYAQVQQDKTAESMVEIHREIQALRGERAMTGEELQRVQDNLANRLAGSLETRSAVIDAVSDNVRLGRPLNYQEIFVEEVQGLDAAAVTEVAREVLMPDRLVWVIVGDLAKIEERVRALDLGTVTVIQADEPAAE